MRKLRIDQEQRLPHGENCPICCHPESVHDRSAQTLIPEACLRAVQFDRDTFKRACVLQEEMIEKLQRRINKTVHENEELQDHIDDMGRVINELERQAEEPRFWDLVDELAKASNDDDGSHERLDCLREQLDDFPDYYGVRFLLELKIEGIPGQLVNMRFKRVNREGRVGTADFIFGGA